MSQVSQCSTVPYEIIDSQDSIFVAELNEVDELYFQNNDSESVLDVGSQFDLINFESDEESDDDIGFDVSSSDEKEYNIQTKFRTETCGCKDFYDGRPCSLMIDFEKLLEYREFCKELSREELDLVVKSELSSHRITSSETSSKKHKIKERERPTQKYFFQGRRICRKVFCFVHAIERTKLQALAKSLDVSGLTARVHGLSKKLPSHSLTYDDRDRIKTFILKYARDNALPLPGRLPNFKQSNVFVLPSDKSLYDIHQLYEASALLLKIRSVSLRTFQRTWHELCPQITLSRPATDLCQTCQDFSIKISKSGNLSEEEKSSILEKYNSHISKAKCQRDYYREQCLASKLAYSDLSQEMQDKGNPPCSVDGTFHYSWDYAQQVHYPHHSHQVGPIYFRTPRKCNVFGICSEGSGRQLFYLIDEAHHVGKGANTVTSMVHHFFETYSHGETDANIHFDNCCGQNKNNVMIWYAMWRVMLGLHKKIELSMMVVGHTKFEPDWHFGIWKNRWRNSNAETMDEVADTVRSSSRSGHNIPHQTDDKDYPVQFFEWRTHLECYFKTLKNLTKYHHFLFSSQCPGIVECKEYVDSEPVTFNLIKKDVCIGHSMPEALPAAIMDLNRQWYLFEQIRPFCSSDINKDISCPRPLIPKKEINLDVDQSSSSKGDHSSKRKSLLLN